MLSLHTALERIADSWVLVSVNRKMLKDYTLSTGDVLPKDAHISFAGVPMSLAEPTFDSPEEFDGFRFERLRRNKETDHNGLQFTSSYSGSLHFGHGRYMCPGHGQLDQQAPHHRIPATL
jgi:ent-kaurene oxidase